MILEAINDKFVLGKEVFQLDFLIPNSYFEKNIAQYKSDQIDTIGILPLRYKMVEDGNWIYMQLNVPLIIKINVYDEVKKARFVLTDGEKFDDNEIEEYSIISITKGLIAIDSTIHVQSLFNVINFIELFNSARINNTIKYTDLLALYKDAFIKNGISNGVPSTLLESMISEMCRDSKDKAKLFRLIAGKNGNETDYTMIGIKNIAETSSTLASLAFENINKAIRTSVLQNRKGYKQRKSPMEDLLKY